MNYQLYFTKRAQADARRIKQSALQPRVEKLLDVLRDNPLQVPPPYEKLVGDLADAYSRRINIQHRLVYQVLETQKAVKILALWTHYQ